MNTTLYDFSEYDSRSERMQLIKDRDFDEYFAIMDQLIEQRTKAADEIIDLVSRYGCVMVRPITNGALRYHRYYVHPRTDKDGLRVTVWDKRGPVGHHYFSNDKELEDELPQRKFTVSVKG